MKTKTPTTINHVLTRSFDKRIYTYKGHAVICCFWVLGVLGNPKVGPRKIRITASTSFLPNANDSFWLTKGICGIVQKNAYKQFRDIHRFAYQLLLPLLGKANTAMIWVKVKPL